VFIGYFRPATFADMAAVDLGESPPARKRVYVSAGRFLMGDIRDPRAALRSRVAALSHTELRAVGKHLMPTAESRDYRFVAETVAISVADRA